MTPSKESPDPIGSTIGTAFAPSLLVHHLHGVLEIGADAVHLVDEREPRYVIPVGLPPDRLRLRLDAADAAEYRDETVEDPEAPLDFDREIDVPRGVDDVDPDDPPIRRSSRRT